MLGHMLRGFGVAAFVAGSPAFGQFAADAPALPPITTAPAAPVQPSPGYTPPAGSVPPATPTAANTIRPATPAGGRLNPASLSAMGANHPLALGPNHGNYLICVKSYSRPTRPEPGDSGWTALQLAEGLATEIRQRFGDSVSIHLFEHISEEKRSEMAARARAIAQVDEFRARLEAERQNSQLKGIEFLDPDVKVRYQTFNAHDQIAVLVGGFATEDEAHKALAVVRKWAPPTQAILMDGAVTANIIDKTKGQGVLERTRLNPFPTAMVVPNPTIARPAQSAPVLDPYLAKLNEGRAYNLLNARKRWTLSVKSFQADCQLQSMTDTNSARKTSSGKRADVLISSAMQAEELAKLLRSMRSVTGQSLGLEAFVLHTRTCSLVTVGQFDGPDDPAMADTRRVLEGLRFNVSRDERGSAITGVGESFFGKNMMPVPIPGK